MGRPPKSDDEKLVTLSVRVSKTSLELLDRIVDGERAYLSKRRLPTRGVHRSSAFRAIWDLGEIEYLLQRVTLWVTRRTNRYSVEQAAEILGWQPDALRRMVRERGVDVPDAAPPAAPPTPPGGEGAGRPPDASMDPRFLV